MSKTSYSYPNTKRIIEITDELAELGKQKYKPEYQDITPYWQRIGGALSNVLFSHPKDVLVMAQEVLEDMNAHSLCHVLAWAFPNLDQDDNTNGNEFDPNKKHMCELEGVQKLINRNDVIILTDWNTGTMSYNTRHARVTVNVEWLD
jgi:hypothetical protein